MGQKIRRIARPLQDVVADEIPGRIGERIELDVADFCNSWPNKYWKNIPGPFYSTTPNLMSLNVAHEAQGHIFYDETCEFYWRQPYTYCEYEQCLWAMCCDEIDSYGIDGNEHWTPQLVAEWWGRRGELLDWASGLKASAGENDCEFWGRFSEMSDREYLARYIEFIEDEAEEYLRSYIFMLAEGRAAQSGDSLPMIEG